MNFGDHAAPFEGNAKVMNSVTLSVLDGRNFLRLGGILYGIVNCVGR